jgi:lysozyme family protein
MDFIIKAEGGYVNNPNDPGGETKYGISKKSYPNCDIAGLSESKAREIYKKDYWEKIKGDYLPFPIDMCAMDFAVNAGVSASETMLMNSKDYKSFLLNRINFYINLTAKKPHLKEFFRGWIIRVSQLKKLCEG